MHKIFKVLILSLFLTSSSLAGSDGENQLSKEQNGEVKDCFETINRGIFAFNEGVRKVIFEPLAKGYLYLPSPIRTGTGNALSNLSLVVTIPNNVLQGNFKQLGHSAGSFVINTTVGILGFLNPAEKIGLN